MRELEKLKNVISSYGKLAIAFSGGVDSTVLAAVGQDVLGDDVILIHVLSPFITHKEKDFAEKWSQEKGFRLINLHLNPLEMPEVKKNCEFRCYYCKKRLMSEIIKKAKELGFDTVADGTNVDDVHKYRPGLKAAKELGIAHPFIKAGVNKEQIRQIAKHYDISNWDMPASACLATRIPTGTEITQDALTMVDRAEKYFDTLGFTGSRVRIIDHTAKIEIDPSQFSKVLNMRGNLVDELKSIGFTDIHLDLQGYRYGAVSKQE